MKALIVGGGIGGLAAALHLHRAGLDVEVYEQSGGVRELGVGINLLPPSVKQLIEFGLGDRLEERAVNVAELIYAHRLGQTIWSEPRGSAAGYEVPQYSVHRGRLQGLLADAVREQIGEAALRPGHRLTRFEADGPEAVAHWVDRNGDPLPTTAADVLIGADGIHSTMRNQMFPDEGPPRWSGVMMWRGATEWPRFREGRTVTIAGGNDAKLVMYPIAPGSSEESRLLNWAVCIKTGANDDLPPQRQDWSRPGRLEELLPHLESFSTPYVDLEGLVRATSEFYEFPMCDRDPLPYWTAGRATLLGDAAHSMYPMGSNGAGQALADGEALARILGGSEEAAAALQAYQDERLPLTAEIVQSNRRGGPERVIDEVQRRAPDGFGAIDDVAEHEELAGIVGGYAQMAGFSREQVNQ